MTSNENPSVANSEFSSCLIIKATLDDETRKVPIANDEITFDELLIMMQRIFKGQLHASDNVTIKYKDEDDDLVTIKDTSDLSFAIACNRVLKLTLFLHEKEEKVFNSDDVKAIRDQLKKMRDFSNYMLDRMGDECVDFLPNGDIEQAEIDKSKENVCVPPTVVNKSQHLTSSSFKDVNLNQSCEFDPLHEKKVHRDSMEQHYEYETDSKRDLARAETPNSIDSSRSASQKPVADVVQPHVAQQHIPQAQIQPQSDNVAMIQPSLHQQVNAPPLAQPSAVNGPPVGPPTMQPYGAGSIGGAAVAPPPFSQPASTYQQQGYPQVATTTTTAPFGGMARPPTSSTPVPPQQQFAAAAPMQQSPAAGYQMQQQQQPTVASIYPQQHYGQQQAFAPPPTSMPIAMQQPMAAYQHQQQQPPPSAMPTATVGYAAPQQQPPMSYAPAGYQQMPPAAAAPPPAVGPPPMGGGGSAMPPGANPFARVSQSPYVRPTAFSGGAAQY